MIPLAAGGLRSTIFHRLASVLSSPTYRIPTHYIRPPLPCGPRAQSRLVSSAPADREANGQRGGRRSSRRIRTLNPARLQRSDFIDISGRITAFVWALRRHGPQQLPARLLYDRADVDGSKLPFPEGTRGFLYYAPPGDLTESGQIRFRVAQEGDIPRAFEEGHDLMRASGVPWHVSPGLLASPRHAGLAELLQEEGLVTQAQLAAWSSYPKSGKRVLADVPVVERFGQPFPVNFARSSLVFWLKAKEGAHYARIGMESGSPQLMAFTQGAGVVCFEPITLGKDGKKAAVLRVLKITEPVKERLGDFLRALPVEGELLSYPRSGKLIWYPADGELIVCRALRAFWEDYERRTAAGSVAS